MKAKRRFPISAIATGKQFFSLPIVHDPVFSWEGTEIQPAPGSFWSMPFEGVQMLLLLRRGMGTSAFWRGNWRNGGLASPCASRHGLSARYARRPHAKALPPNPKWEPVLHLYSALHRSCFRSVGNLADHFLSGSSTSGFKFLLMEIEGVGLGNKVALLVSAVLCAVLTQRGHTFEQKFPDSIDDL